VGSGNYREGEPIDGGDGGLGRLPKMRQEMFEHTDGELSMSFTVCGGTEIDAGEMGEMATGRIAMEDL
jgi:hypothetical protein